MKQDVPAVKMLGVAVHKLSIIRHLELISDSIRNSNHQLFANHNLHSIYHYHHDEKMRFFYSCSDYISIDGMSLVVIGKLLGHSLRRDNRMTTLDWSMPLFAEAAQQGWRIIYLGSGQGVAERGAQILRARYPGMQMATFHGYFNVDRNSEDNLNLLSKINSYRPHIVMVGMGMPRQEHWIIDNYSQLNTNVILNVGAYMDYIAGVIPTPPRWIGRMGLEGLYRLVCEPKRLWRRYLLEPWFIGKLFIKEAFTNLRKRTTYGRLNE